MKRLPLNSRGPRVSLDFEGTPVEAFEGEPVAAALLSAGERVLARSVKYHRPRGPFCFSGACSHCLMRVDGAPNTFACRTPVRDGMRVERQNAFPSAKVDVFRAIDWLFPRGLDHHEMFAGVPVAEQVMAKVARHLAGLGLLPDGPAPLRPPAERIDTQVAIVGAGPAGLGAAEALAKAGIRFVLVERDGWLGGRLASAAPWPESPAIPALGAFPEGSVRLGATAIGLFDDEQGRFLAVVSGEQLFQIHAPRFVLALGGSATLPPFANNDLPGIHSARAASALVRRWGVLPGEAIVCAGTGDELKLTAALLSSAGAEVPLVLEGEVIAAHGRTGVRAISYRDGRGRERKVACDALVLAHPPAPAFELARQAGALTLFDPRCGFRVDTNPNGATAAPGVFVAGEALGPASPLQAVESGQRAAAEIAEGLA
jgi:sarcosine oxidase subunit alpha